MIAQCVTSGHYKTALRLCHLCGVSYTQPLEALTIACSQIQDNDKAWEWLFLNEISGKYSKHRLSDSMYVTYLKQICKVNYSIVCNYILPT